MNMISTGAFLPETDASTKQNELVKKLTAAWEKKNSKTARAGGASLMALSLAACGGEDNTPFSAADVSAAEAAATTAALTGADGTVYASVDAAVTSNDAAIADAARAEGVASVDITTDNQAAIDAAVAAVDLTTDNAAATDAAVAADTAFASLADLVAAYDALATPTGQSATLTDDGLTGVGPDVITGTGGDDTYTGTGATLDAADVITDPSSTDNDTLTITLANDVAGTAPAAITNIENIVYNVNDFAGGVAIDVAGIVGATVTVNNTQAGTTVTGLDVNNVGQNMTIVAGTGVTGTVDVAMAASSNAVIDMGGAGDLIATAGAATDTITVKVSDDITADFNVATTAAIEASADVEITLDDAGALTTINGSGAGALTIDHTTGGTPTFGDFDEATITGVARLVSVGDTADLTGVDAATIIEVESGAAADLTLTAAASVQVVATGLTLDLDYSDGTTSDVTTSATVTVDNNAAAVATIAAVTIEVDDAASTDNIDTLNVVLNEDVTTLTITTEGLASDGVGGVTAGDITLNLSGAGDTTLANNADLQGSVNAAAMTGNLSATAATGLLGITGGSGNDNITIGTTALAYSLNGGAGTDTIVIGAARDLSNATLTGFEVVSGNFDATFSGSQLSGATYSMVSAAAVVDVINTATLDFSGLTFSDTTNDGVTVTAVYGGDVAAGDAVTITGSAGADSFTTGAGNDIIDGGAGVDTIDGGNGNNTLSGGAGGDTITGGAGVDTISGGAGGDTIDGGSGADVIDGGAGDDEIQGTTTSTITLGTGNDTLKTAEGTGLTSTVTVTDFTFGAVNATVGGDKIDLSGAGNAAGSAAAGATIAAGVIQEDATAAQAWDDGDMLFLNVAALASYDSKAEINTLFSATTEFSAFATGEEATLFISAEDTGHIYVWDLEESGANTSIGDDADTVSLVAILQNLGSDDLTAAVEGNFIA